MVGGVLIDKRLRLFGFNRLPNYATVSAADWLLLFNINTCAPPFLPPTVMPSRLGRRRPSVSTQDRLSRQNDHRRLKKQNDPECMPSSCSLPLQGKSRGSSACRRYHPDPQHDEKLLFAPILKIYID